MKKIMLSFLLILAGFTMAAAGGASEQTTALPVKPTVVTWWDWSDSMQNYAKAMFAKFEKDNPDIKVEYSLYTIEQLNNAVTLASRSGDFPDISTKPNNYTFMKAMDTGWYQAMDSYVNKLWPGGLAAWKARYPEGSFIEGLNMYKGQVYTSPKVVPGYGALVYYNKDLFRKAGLDPERPPRTWSELREYARKINEAGKGQFSGFIEGGKQVARWQQAVEGFAATMKPVGINNIDYRTGQYQVANEAFSRAINLFKDIMQDGSFYPATMSIDAREARALFGLGKAGFLVQGHWCIGTWQRENPDLDFGVMFPPLPDGGRGGYIPDTPMAYQGELYMLSATSKAAEAAMRLYLFRTSDEFTTDWVKSGDGFAPFPALNTRENLPFSQLYDIISNISKEKRVNPMPVVRNPLGVGAVEAELRAVNPGLSAVIQGVLTGQVSDIDKALAELNAKLNAELDRAIAVAREKGATVSRQDWVFTDWDPMSNYYK